jgi:hypothetical protein
MTFVEYEWESESLELLKGDCLRPAYNKLSPIKNMSYSRNDLKKLLSHVKSISEHKFLRKYMMIVEVRRMFVLN